MILETVALSALLAASSSTPVSVTKNSEADTLQEIVSAGIVVETPLFRVGPASGGGGGWGKAGDPE